MNEKPRYLNIGSSPDDEGLTQPLESKFSYTDIDDITDESFTKQSFFLPDEFMISQQDVINRRRAAADVKFNDTRFGGSIGLNSRPQYTPYADIPRKGRLEGRTDVSVQNTGANYGLGRYWVDALDNNKQVIYLRAGHPQYNSLLGFINGAFNKTLTSYARTGRTSAWHDVGNVIGTIIGVTALPALSATIITGRLISTMFGRTTSKFYSLKPDMFGYWSTVSYLINTVAINAGLMPRTYQESYTATQQEVYNPYKLDAQYLDMLHSMMPDVFTDRYGIDCFAVSTRAQRLYNAVTLEEYVALNNASSTNFTGYVKKFYTETVAHPAGDHTFVAWVKAHMQFNYYNLDDTQNTVEMDPKIDPATGLKKDPQGVDMNNFKSFFDAEFQQGSQFVSFVVNATGPVSESFSNATAESDIQQKFNSISSTASEARFSTAEGSLGNGPIANTVESFLGAVKDVGTGIFAGATLHMFDGVQGLLGQGYVDIPKKWQSSSAQLPRCTYTMQLRTPYNNIISRIQNIYLPICALLALSLPKSTGNQSYTSPYLIQLFDPGRMQIQTGIMESITINRGVGNLGFTNKFELLAVDVSFTFMDMSTIMHVPVSTGSLLSAAKDTLQDLGSTLLGVVPPTDEDSILSDYLAVLAGQDVYSQIYPAAKARLAMAKGIQNLHVMNTPAHWAAFVHSGLTSGMLSNIMIGNALEGYVGGNGIIPKRV